MDVKENGWRVYGGGGSIYYLKDHPRNHIETALE